MKAILKQVIFEQQERNVAGELLRKLPENLISNNEILIISGVRRCGKSVLLQQIRNNQKDKNYFINFDDERLIKFTVDNFQELIEVFHELYGEQHVFYFDEIQNIEGWERFVRRLHDAGNKIFITGSNANMLSRELGTHLTGRFCQYELFPFSFREVLDYKEIGHTEKDRTVTKNKSILVAEFEKCMVSGGFPQYIKNNNDEYIKSLYESILYKDVMVRNRLNNEREILELVYYLSSNVAKTFSYSKLAELIGIKHPTTIKNHIEFIENTYLLFQLSKYDYSLKKQISNNKKVYFIDNIIPKKLGFNISENNGRMLENLVYVELRRTCSTLFYHAHKHECDFLVQANHKIAEAYQVCYELNDDNSKRELLGITEAMEMYDLKEGTILTLNQEETKEIEGKIVRVLPIWKWLLTR